MTDRPPDAGGEPGTPRWVKVFGIIAIIVILLVGFLLITGLGGSHGPHRHAPSVDARGAMVDT